MSSTIFSEDLAILREFVAECNDMIADVEEKIISLSPVIKENKTPDLEDINAIFRLFHTIKGTSGFLNLIVMQDVTHEAESLLDAIRKGEKKLLERHLDVFISSIDFLKEILPVIEDKGVDTDFEKAALVQIAKIKAVDQEEEWTTVATQATIEVKEYQNFKEESLKDLDTLTAEVTFLLDEPADLQALERSFVLITNLDHNFLLQNIKDFAQLTSCLKAFFKHLLDNNFKLHIEDLTVVAKLLEVISEALLLDSEKITNVGGMAEFMRDIIKHDLDSYKVNKEESSSEIVITEEKRVEEELPSPSIQVADKIDKIDRKEIVGEKFIRVDMDKIDKLIDWIGELSIAEMMLINNPDIKNAGIPLSGFENAAHNVNRILSEIQYISMSLRMVPIKGAFGKMSRLVHDLTTKFKKEVKLITEGDDTEIDKNVAEQIIDPLMHMVRNSFDHGIEPANERIDAGKGSNGTISLSAKHIGGEIWISISDDGRGLNREKILEKAINNGLVDIERAKHLTDSEIYNFIFQAGFSTAVQLSELSGRGVGMDVVKRNIEQIKGVIDINSKSGVGSSFTLKIPLTMAIMEALLIRVGHNRYTIPLAAVTECSRPEMSEITTSPGGEEFVQIRKGMVQIVRLHRLFEITPDSPHLHEGILMTIKNGSEVFCLFVDEIMEQLQAIVKPLPEDLGQIKGLSGCTILGDGSISPIVDVTGILALNREKNEE